MPHLQVAILHELWTGGHGSMAEDLEAILPDVPYVGITLTMPAEFRPILQQNRHLLHGVPAMGAEAILQWARASSGVRLIVLVVQQTFGGFLNFVPHLHIMVSAGGLQESTNRWIARLRFNEKELMQAWRFALVALLSEACKKNILKSDLSSKDLQAMLAAQYKREWQIYVNRARSKSYQLKHDGRYIRRPPVAQHRIMSVDNGQIEYLAKDTRHKQFVLKYYKYEEFVDLLSQYVPERGRHAMRYFGLLAPRSKAKLWAGIFVMLNQRPRPHPTRRTYRERYLRTWGNDPLQDSHGHPMCWVGRRVPIKLA